MFSYRWKQLTVFSVVSLGLILGACSDDNNNPTEPEPPPEIPTVTETFRGGIGQNEIDCNTFTMNNDGTIELEIVELEPLQTITMGMSIGVPDSSVGSGCSTIADDNSVRIFQTFASSGLVAGRYCTCIFDVGNIFPGETVTYAQEVTHPE